MLKSLLSSSTRLSVLVWIMNLGKSVRLIFRKAFQKTLTKQGMKFKLSTKVISAKKNADGKVDVVVEAATGGSPETVIDFA